MLNTSPAADPVGGAVLRILPTASVLPHEIADQRREQNIKERLRAEGILRDPVMVGALPDLDRSILLDGTNRKLALSQLGYPLIVAQVLDYADESLVQLRTWCHAAALPLETILTGAHTIPGIEISPLHPLGAADALADRSTLAILLDRQCRYVLSRIPGTVVPRPVQLRQLVDIYEDRMTRQDCSPDQIERRVTALSTVSSEPVTLLAFPAFSRGQVVQMAIDEMPIPAGITRHVIQSGRALRVNIPLGMLTGQACEANQRLQEYLATLHPRAYREPTILYDS